MSCPCKNVNRNHSVKKGCFYVQAEFAKTSRFLGAVGHCHTRGRRLPEIWRGCHSSHLADFTVCNSFPCQRAARLWIQSIRAASNPTVEVAEQKTAALEGGEDAVCFASGMAAISSVLFHYLQKDCHIIAVRDVYASAYSLLKDWLPARTGATVTFVDGRNFSTIAAAAKSNPHTRLIYLESPSSGVFTCRIWKKRANSAETQASQWL